MMSMMTLVIGPNNSGKSAVAESLARRLRDDGTGPGGRLFYIATMIPADDDGRRRVAAHRRSRAGAGFITIESPLADGLAGPAGSPGASDIVLLEDVSNLLANLIFTAHDAAATTTARQRIQALRDACRHLIAVTIGGLAPEPGFDDDTLAYIAALDELNTTLAAEAAQVITRPGPAGGAS